MTAGWARFRQHRAAVVGLCLLMLLVTLALAAPLLSDVGVLADPYRLSIDHANEGVSIRSPLGTDGLGRDLLSRTIHGARVSLSVGLLVQFVVLAIGGTMGLAAGLSGGWVDNVLMRITDAMYALPALLFVLVMASVVGPGYWNILLVIGVASWATMARIVRGQVLAVKHQDHVEAARAVGTRGLRLVRRHVVPSCVAPITVVLVFGVPSAILIEAFLSFIGIGVRPPAPSWGTMIGEGYPAVFANPLEVVVPATAIALAALSITLLGDGLRDAVDPRPGR